MSGAGPSGPGGRSRGGKVRVKTARKRSPQSAAWLERHLNDPYVAAAKAQGYRSRAAFKLKELDEQFGLLAGVDRVVDLGAAPGGWCQVVKQKLPKARVVGMDLLAIEPLAGVDGAGAEIISGLVQDLSSRGVTVVWVHHDLAEVKRIADKVTCINRTVSFSGPPEEVLTRESILEVFSPAGGRGLASGSAAA